MVYSMTQYTHLWTHSLLPECHMVSQNRYKCNFTYVHQKQWPSLHKFLFNSTCSIATCADPLYHISPNYTRSVDRISFTPLHKLWLSLSQIPLRSQSHNKSLWKFLVSNLIRIEQKMQKTGKNFYFYPWVKHGCCNTYFHETHHCSMALCGNLLYHVTI